MDKPLAKGTIVDQAAWNQFATAMIKAKRNLALMNKDDFDGDDYENLWQSLSNLIHSGNEVLRNPKEHFDGKIYIVQIKNTNHDMNDSGYLDSDHTIVASFVSQSLADEFIKLNDHKLKEGADGNGITLEFVTNEVDLSTSVLDDFDLDQTLYGYLYDEDTRYNNTVEGESDE